MVGEETVAMGARVEGAELERVEVMKVLEVVKGV